MIMGLWDGLLHGTYGTYDYGTMGRLVAWDYGTYGTHGTYDYGTMGLWDHGTAPSCPAKPPRTTHYSLLTTHYALRTTHYALRTTHCASGARFTDALRIAV